MTATETGNLSVALQLAEQGVYVHPLRYRSKVPLTAHGHKDATTDVDQIRAWWERWPNANIGLNLPLSGLVAIDPDSEEAQAEAISHGLPPTVTRHSHHGGYLYKRPEGCPITRAIGRGKSKALDILSNGLFVVYGTHQQGDDIFLEPFGEPITEPCPEWAVQILRGADRGDAPPPSPSDDEPPVRLSEKALARWKGELFSRKGKDGELDRSDSLFWLGVGLAEAGLTYRGIVDELRESDIRLGWKKYSERRDGAVEYARIAQKALDIARQPHIVFTEKPPPRSDPPPDGKCEGLGCCAACVVEINDLRRQLEEAREHHRQTMSMFRSAQHKPNEKMAIVSAVYRWSEEVSHGADPAQPVRVSIGTMAESMGVSRQRASVHLNRWKDAGLIGLELRRQYLAEEDDYRTETYLTLPCGSPAATLSLARATDLTREKSWGGSRTKLPQLPACPDHPTEEALLDWRVVCPTDGQILERGAVAVAEVPDVFKVLMSHLETSEPEPGPGPGPSTVERTNTSHLETSAEGPPVLDDWPDEIEPVAFGEDF